MRFIALLSTCLLLGATGTVAQVYNSFINCVTFNGVPATDVHTGADAVSSDTCITKCLTTDYRYAYHTISSTMEGTVLGEPACSCSNTQIDATTVTRTTAVGDISCFDPTHFQVYVLRTTSRFDGCSQGDGPEPTQAGKPFLIPNPGYTFEQCLIGCVNFDTIYFQASPNRGIYDHVYCVCQTKAYSTPTRCGTGDEGNNDNYYTMFRRIPGAGPSGGFRKRSKSFYCPTAQPGSFCDTSIYHTSHPTRELQQDLCPSGLSACNVPGQIGSYECLDTENELESCGGCLAGEFGNSTSSKGVDCLSAFPEAGMGSVSCSGGACLLY